MRPDEPLPPDEEQAEGLAESLAEFDEALASGRGPRDGPEPRPAAEAGSNARLDRARACLRMLEEAWPRFDATLSDATPPGAPPIVPDLAGEPGQFGRFRIHRQLGRGGGGVVFLATDPTLNRRVALKVPQPEGLMTPSLRRRFLREAEAAAGLDHPNIVPVFEVGDVGPVCYIASAYCEGPSLAEWLRQRPGSASPAAAARIVADLASAVDHAHRRGILHRDIKPGNVLLLPRPDAPAGAAATLDDSTPRLTDFGLAKLLDDSAAESTRSGVILGTPSYMAPEQAEGRGRSIGPATDVYALGVVLYELLVDRPPFRGDSDLGTLRLVVSEEPVPPRRLRPSTPRDLEVVCLKCLEKDPRDRYPDATSLAEDLRRTLAGEPILARPTPAWRLAARWVRRRPAAASLIGSAAAAALIVAAGVLWHQAELSIANERLRKSVALEQQVAEEAHRLRLVAERRERQAMRHLYAVDLRTAQREHQSGRPERAIDLLDAMGPVPGQADPRGFAWHFLREQIRSEVELIDGHTGHVHGIAVSPDGSTVATAGKDGLVQFWDLPGRRRRAVLETGWGISAVMAFAPDGRSVVGRGAASDEHPHEVVIWDPATGRERARPSTGVHRIQAMAIAPGSDLLATAGTSLDGTDGELALWDLATGDRSMTLRAGDGPCLAAAFSPDGTTLAAGGPGGSCLTWSVPDGRLVRRLDAHRDDLTAVAFSPDGSLMATAGDDLTVRIWDAATADTRATLEGHDRPVTMLAFSPDGRSLITGSEEDALRLWDAETWSLRETIDRHGKWNREARFSPDGRYLVTAGEDPFVRLREARTGRSLREYRHETRGTFRAVFTPDGRSMILSCFDPRLRLWHLTEPPPDRTVAGHRDEVWGLAYSPDGQTLVTVADDGDEDGVGTIRRWDAGEGRLLDEPAGHIATVTSVAFSPDGSLMATASFDGTVRLWGAADARPVAVLRDHERRACSVAFSPDGKLLASAGYNGRVSLREADGLRDAGTLVGHDGHSVRCVAFSPDGEVFASAGEDGVIHLWDVASRSPVASLNAPMQPSGDPYRMAVWTIAFSPDGRTLASGDAWGAIVLWDVRDASSRAVLRAHSDDIRGVAFSPDGTILASASDDRSVRLWDASTGQELLVLEGHAERVNAVAFSPDGRTLASGSHDGEVLLWRADPARDAADRREGRPDPPPGPRSSR